MSKVIQFPTRDNSSSLSSIDRFHNNVGHVIPLEDGKRVVETKKAIENHIDRVIQKRGLSIVDAAYVPTPTYVDPLEDGFIFADDVCDQAIINAIHEMDDDEPLIDYIDDQDL